jgi:hypothetical protein
MNKLTLTTVLAVLLLVGCAHRDHGRTPPPYGSCPCPNPANPQVTVDGNDIKLDQEILVFAPGVRGAVTWTLPANSSLRFPDNGIVIEGRLLDQVIKGKQPSVVLDPDQKEVVDCRPSTDRLQFTCVNNHTFPGVYKYTIRVRSGERVIERDPPWVNM